jgi:ribosomal protein S10
MTATKTTAETTQKKEESVSRIRIKIRAYDNRIIDQATKTIVETAERHVYFLCPKRNRTTTM